MEIEDEAIEVPEQLPITAVYTAPDLSDPRTVQHLSVGPPARAAMRKARAHAKRILDTTGLEQALRSVEESIRAVRAAAKRETKLQLFLAFLCENFAWIVNQASESERDAHLATAIELLTESLKILQPIPNTDYYKIEQSALLLNMLLDQHRLDTDALEKTAANLSQAIEARRRELRVHDILQQGRARIALAKYYYSRLDHGFLTYSFKSRTVLRTGLELWLAFLRPRLARPKLEHEHKPQYQNWKTFELHQLQEYLVKKDKDERLVEQILGQCREMLYRVAKDYSRLGAHSLAHRILRLADTYDPATKRQSLEYVLDIAEIEERENLFKAIDRLQLILNDSEGKRGTKRDVRYTLAKLYGLVGLKEPGQALANQVLKDPSCDLTTKDKARELFARPENNKVAKAGERPFDQLLNNAFQAVTREQPDTIVHTLGHLSQALLKKNMLEDSCRRGLHELHQKVWTFYQKWQQHSETKAEADWINRDATKTFPSTLSEFADRFSAIAAALCITHEPQLAPRYLRILYEVRHQAQPTDHHTSHILIKAAERAASLSDWSNFRSAFNELRPVINEAAIKEGIISREEVHKLAKSAIAVAEDVMEEIVFIKERDSIIRQLTSAVEHAVFALASIKGQSQDESERQKWIFRGANVLKARGLTAIQIEHPWDLEPEEKAELRRLSWEEMEQRTQKDRDFGHSTDELLKKKKLETKLELLIKAEPLGLGRFEPNMLRQVLKHFLPEHICALSVLTSKDGRLLVTGVSNFDEECWHWLSPDVINPQDIVDNCWRDIGFAERVDNLSLCNLRDGFKLFIEPVLEYIRGADLLYIIPDQRLYNVPFHALHGAIDGEERFMIERFQVAYAPSALLLWHLLRSRPMSRANLALGSGSEDIGWNHESEYFSSNGFEIGRDFDLGQDVRDLLRDRQRLSMLYIIGHGFPESTPLESHIQIATKKDILNLKAKEFASFGPKARFVFLNSCYGGISRAYGTDVVGFPFCLLGAGNGSCLVAAAPVDTDFAKWFAREVVEGTVTASGSRLTEIVASVIRKTITKPEAESWSRPYYWAPYYFYGDFRGLTQYSLQN